MRFPRPTLAAILAVSLSSLTMTACGSGSGDGGGTDVKFGYISDYNGASLLAIAENQGLWEDAGLNVDVKSFTNGPVQIQALGAGDLDFGYIGPGAMWLPASGKCKVVAVNTLAYADRVIAQPGISSIEDLKGKKVGVPEGTSGEMALNLALEDAGMSPGDVEKVPMEPSTVVSAFSSGQIDGAGIWYPLIDTIKEKVPELNEVASTRDMGDKSFPTAFVGGNGVDEETTTEVIGVLQEANDWRAEHPDETISQTAEMLEISAEDVERDAANVETMPTADLVKATEDGTTDQWLNGLSEFFVDTGQLQSVPAPEDYYTGDLYTKAYEK
ncbi:aliphatic sulfonate ABC transporter substrate-binding protein [Streptomonospora wellingtoniae]|uniref:Aliphatic sulfonate ABC transporter substrate-binding protein n=1 Tax=Streptomonospora wellingtoniae TaxID=3075544 RepID=A0ABU2KQE9_9ACTN|nr:aliphatic sulfonate ABC transporter substrate-binding protein [Streptomonospora sp. DSM 45055]MDT0301363.1 aliphatic sulfonate ABC transporter substrate-binding protein [Streptomonospora sp. DSM 45055]